MATSNVSLICPLSLEIFRDPVLAQDGHTYEREAIENWIRKNGTSPITDQLLSLDHLYPNHIVKKLVGSFESSLLQKKYHFILDIDIKKKKGRPLFQTYGKCIYHAEWLPNDSNQFDIIILKIDGARALKEASYYVNLTRHPHIVRTFGFVLDQRNNDDNDSVMLVQEYAPEGSLLELVQERNTPLEENILIEIFIQIIDAMIFLAYNHVVHGDLACRNVLVFRFDETNLQNIIVKVTDFGLSRESKLYSKTLTSARTTLNIVPVRYAAPEILLDDSNPENYTEKSDVYSMGILMWEAYSRGTLPWSKINKDADIIQNVLNSVLLSQPSSCSSKYWNIITKTWLKLPSDRPTFEQLKRLLMGQIYLPEVNSLNEERTYKSNGTPSSIGDLNDILTSQLRLRTEENLLNMDRDSQQGTIEEPDEIIETVVTRIPLVTQTDTTTTSSIPPTISDQTRERTLKVLVIGEMTTGKTAFIKRYVHNSFSRYYQATIGVDFALKIIKYDEDTVIRLQLWDIAGMERMGNLTRVYYKEAVGCFIVFDVTRKSTFDAVIKWKIDLDAKVQLPDRNPIPCVLLANKCDLPKDGSIGNAQQIDEFCREQGFAKWFETSAKENINTETAVNFLVDEIMAHLGEIPSRLSLKQRTDTINVVDKAEERSSTGSRCWWRHSS